MSLILAAHIAFGFIALLLGPVAFVADKWGRVHRLAGLCFVFAMLGVYLTSTYISVMKGLFLLFCVGHFSFFNVLIGYRAAGFFRGHRARWFDRACALLALAVGLGMLVYAIYSKKEGDTEELILFGLFGVACSAIAVEFLRRVLGWPSGDRRWIKQHIGGMIGGYTATVTAFVVTAIRPEPALLGWIGPSLILPLALSWWARRFLKRNRLG